MTIERIFIEQVYRDESARILATLIRLLGDFDLAEEVTQEAFAVAVEQWPRQGVPEKPRAWLVSTARNKAVDLIRRRMRFEKKQEELQRFSRVPEQRALVPASDGAGESENAMLSDDRLRLIFTCCHPALRTESQVALTLRTLCGLSTGSCWPARTECCCTIHGATPGWTQIGRFCCSKDKIVAGGTRRRLVKA